MKHSPQLPDESVNVSREPPLKELARLGSGVILIAVLVFVISGVLVDAVVGWLPEDTGAALRPQVADTFRQQFGDEIDSPRATRTKQVFAALVDAAGLDADAYTLLVIDNDMVNALAGPAHVLAVMRGLIDAADSENELAMVLAHELGHVQHKDPMRSLGRGIILSGLAALIFGNSDAINSRLILSPTSALQKGYSRGRESAADRFALELVCRVYGHRGGAADFFARHGDDLALPAFFTTHPSPTSRVERLREIGAELDCPEGDVTPL